LPFMVCWYPLVFWQEYEKVIGKFVPVRGGGMEIFMKIFLISDNVDTQTGMRLAGVDGVVAHTYEEVSSALNNALADKDIGILLVTVKLSSAYPKLFKEIKLTQKTPLVVDIPDRHGPGASANAIAEYISEAVGIKI
jgi:V/A-type H+-transporting ATPase subunit F